jgi:hypothetical protein
MCLGAWHLGSALARADGGTAPDSVGRVRLDHLILAVGDLDAAAAALTERTGLAVLPGGVHPRWGTANRIVPLGDAYLELVTVVDRTVAEGTAFGRAVVSAGVLAEGAAALVGWAVEPEDFEATAERLGVDVVRGRRDTPVGGTLSWAMAGVDEALDHGLPFFLRWDDDTANPARATAPHAVAPAGGVEWLEPVGDRARLAEWLGGEMPHGVDVRPAAGPARAGIALTDGTTVVVPAPDRPRSRG